MNEANKEYGLSDDYIAGVFVTAISKVALQEYGHLTTGLRPFQIMERLTPALVGLRGLKRRKMPDYDDWTSLCHLTWYQPHHINLAYTILGDWSDYIRKTLVNARIFGGFRWLDFGCGSLPLHMALYASSALGRVLPYSDARIFSTGIDPSGSMVRIGRAVVSEIQRIDPRLAPGTHNLVTFANVEEYSSAHAFHGKMPTILSVMHAFYPENITEVSSAIQSLIELTDPELILVTSNPDSEILVDDAFAPFADRYDHARRRYDYNQPLRFKGRIRALTELRQGWADIVDSERVDAVNEGLSAQRDYAGVNDFGFIGWDGVSPAIRETLVGSDVQFINDTDTAINYLNGEVTWSGADVEAKVFYRKPK